MWCGDYLPMISTTIGQNLTFNSIIMVGGLGSAKGFAIFICNKVFLWFPAGADHYPLLVANGSWRDKYLLSI